MAIEKITQEHITAVDGTSEAAREQYEHYGIILVPNVFSDDEMERLGDIATAHADSDDPSMRDVPKILMENDPLKKYARLMHPHRYPNTAAGRASMQSFMDQRMLSIARNLMGPVYGAQTMFYFKPGGARGQALHQDNWFLQAHPETCLAGWIAVDDADEENGGIAIIPGSHRQEIMCHGQSDITKSFSPTQIQLPSGVDFDGLKLQTRLKKGDVLFFHGSLVHGSPPNSSASRFRRSLICHYIPQDSIEVARQYMPLVTPQENDIRIPAAAGGGPCGENWLTDEAQLAV